MSNKESVVIVRASELAKANARINELKEALIDLLETAYQCDGWEYFPQDALDDAQAALDK